MKETIKIMRNRAKWNCYNEIPKEYLVGSKTVLDVGCGYCWNQVNGKHKNIFLKLNSVYGYLGIDPEADPEQALLRMRKMSLQEFAEERHAEFDLVLAIHVLEHVEREGWEDFISTLKSYVKEGGHLIIMTPYDEQERPLGDHQVFGIVEDSFERFFSRAEISIVTTGRWVFNFRVKPLKRFVWYFWGIVKRRVFKIPFYHPLKSILLIWRNEKDV